MAKGLAAREDFNPAEYKAVGYFYKGDSTDLAHEYRHDVNELVSLLGEDLANDVMSRGPCESCGTWYNHGAVIQHIPSGNYLAIGQICGVEYFGFSSVQDFKRAEAQKKAERVERERAAAERAAEFLAEHDGLAEALDVDHYISEDLKFKLHKWGDLSERQVELAFKIQREAIERAEREANQPPSVPVVTGEGLTVEGTILTVKWQDSPFAYNAGAWKMLVLVETDSGVYKLWGTQPSAIDSTEKGDRVRFVANVEVSSDDESFGFFKRPRKAEVLEDSAELAS